MAQRTLEHFYTTYAEAVQVVADLTAAGVPAGDVTMFDSEADPRLPSEVTEDTGQNPAGTGATLGTGIGGAFGALLGVGAVSIPYTQPLVQTGWIVPTITFAGIGAAIGALIGAVARPGVTNRRAHAIAEGLNRGNHLVVVRIDEAYAAQVDAILRQPRAVPRGPEPAFDMVPVDDTRSTAQIQADIERRERTIDYGRD